MSCGFVRARFSAFVDRELPTPELRAVSGHLEACEACAAELRCLRDALSRLADLPVERPTGWVVTAVMDRIELERRGPGLQLLFRSPWKARPLFVASLLHATFVFVLVLSGVLTLDRRGPQRPDPGLGAWEAQLAPSGTEANPLFPSAQVDMPRLRARGEVPEPFLLSAGESSVFIETVVGRDGRVSAVTLIEGDGAAGQALAVALKAERFEPTRVRGRPVAVSLYRLFSRMEVRDRST